MGEDDRWSCSEVVEQYGDEIRRWREEDRLGRTRLAARITDESGRFCSGGVMGVALARMGFGDSKRKQVSIKEKTPPRPDPLSIEELIQSRIRAFKRKKIKTDIHRRTLHMPAEPLAIMLFGDPHLDNEGCDWEALMDHIDCVRETEGVLAACVGDMTDNWIGRLQRMYADSSCMASDGWRLSAWFLDSSSDGAGMTWVAVCGGNHDQWSHAPGTDPLKWISKEAKVRCYAPDEIYITLKWQDHPELEPVRWVLRHDFKGRSFYHPTHGGNKAGMISYPLANILTAGHIHNWGELTQEMPNGRICKSVRVGSYKKADSYAREKGFLENQYGEGCLIVIDPFKTGPGRITIHWDVRKGCDYLTHLRGR